MDADYPTNGVNIPRRFTVLCRRGEQDFITRTREPPEAEPVEPEDALEMGERHLHLFALAARLLEGVCVGESANPVANILVDVARYPA